MPLIALIASIGGTIPGLFGVRLSYQSAKIVGFAVLALLLISLLSIGKCAYDASVINEHEAEAEAASAKARENAAEQRVKDAVANVQSEEELNHVIESAPPGGTLSPAARALACERLRRIGRSPPACR